MALDGTATAEIHVFFVHTPGHTGLPVCTGSDGALTGKKPVSACADRQARVARCIEKQKSFCYGSPIQGRTPADMI